MENINFKIGIDEAGRGPCLGPMVICGVLIKEEQEKKLKELNIKDSKLHTKLQREKLYKILKKKEIILDYKIIKLTPKKIDSEINSNTSNLNTLEAKTSVRIINYLLKKNNNSYNKSNKFNLNYQIIIDCPSINTKKYCSKIKEKIISNNIKTIKVYCEHKADLNHIVVSSASILAKVKRDLEIEKIQKKYPKKKFGNIGSGYPSDVQTIEFLKRNIKKLDNEDLFRKTWQTYKKIKNEKNQKKLIDF